MYSLYIVWYIFLAGMGSGAYAVASVMGFAGKLTGWRNVQEYGRIAEGGFIIGPTLVILGAIFLLFDLGSPEKAYLVILNPNLSVLSIGVWLILLYCSITGLLVLDHLHPLVQLARWLRTILQALAFILSIGLMTYTGVFLATMPPMPFHNNWLLVLLFVLSSLSTGAAVIALYGFLNQHHKAMRYGLNIVPKIDAVLLLLEIICLGVYLLTAYLRGPEAQYSLELLLFGEFAPLFWVVVLFLGLLLPLFFACTHGIYPRWNIIACSSVLAIVGGFALRFCIISAGFHITQLLELI